MRERRVTLSIHVPPLALRRAALAFPHSTPVASRRWLTLGVGACIEYEGLGTQPLYVAGGAVQHVFSLVGRQRT